MFPLGRFSKPTARVNNTMLAEVRRDPEWAREKPHGLKEYRKENPPVNSDPAMYQAVREFMLLNTRPKSDKSTWVILSGPEATKGKKVRLNTGKDAFHLGRAALRICILSPWAAMVEYLSRYTVRVAMCQTSNVEHNLAFQFEIKMYGKDL